MNKITVLTFGAVAEIIGENRFEVSDVLSTDGLKARLEIEFPRLKEISYALAVDKKMITAPIPLHPNATVALLPPFSGG